LPGKAFSFNGTGDKNQCHHPAKSDGTGLGLAIVKQICGMYALTIFYEYRIDEHHFRITFTKDHMRIHGFTD
jgi:hypothetical protein